MPKIPEAELTAICDVDTATREKVAEATGVPAFATHTELLDSGLVDAVIIATPHYFHPPIAIDAFARGIHVMSEKPLGVTVGAVDEMIAAAEKSGCKFSVMYQMRSFPSSIAAKDIVASGALGEIYRTSLVMGWYRSQAYYDSGGWRATWDGEGGGVLINQAPHYLDLFTWLGGLPATVSGDTRTRIHDIEVEDEAFALLEYANGAHGYLYASTTEVPNHNMLEICGDKGKIVLHGSDLKHYTVNGSIKEFTQTSTKMWSDPETVSTPVTLPEVTPITDHARITQNLARAILYGDTLIAPGAEGLNAVEMINAMILSGKTSKKVSVPVNRAEYAALIEELKATSHGKSNLREQRVTDPQHG
jgi:predicted dehydrogenase